MSSGESAAKNPAAPIDMSAVLLWRLEPGYLRPPQHSPERVRLRGAAAEYGVPEGLLDDVLDQLSLGWSIRSALQRAAVPSPDWGLTLALLQHLVSAGVVVRADNRTDPKAFRNGPSCT